MRFRVYISNKPGRYGIKILWLNESSTGFALNSIPYIGKKTLTEDKKSGVSIPEAVTVKLLKPYLQKGFNVTTDNWFTSSPLAENLMQNKTTIVGTVRANRHDIPPHAKSVRHREKKSSVYYASDNHTMLSYYDKGNKPVLLLSTMHTSAKNDDNGIPEIVSFYNETKGGTDNMDHMIRLYRSGKVSRRWPLTFFFNMIDVALLNGCVYRSLHTQRNSKRFRRRFLLDVGYELVDPYTKMRLNSERLPIRILNATKLIGY